MARVFLQGAKVRHRKILLLGISLPREKVTRGTGGSAEEVSERNLAPVIGQVRAKLLLRLIVLPRKVGFEPKAQGIKMMLPHVDEFRPVHNLASIEGLIAALSSPLPPHHFSRIRSAA